MRSLRRLGRKIDKTVRKLPGGWLTVGALAGGGYLLAKGAGAAGAAATSAPTGMATAIGGNAGAPSLGFSAGASTVAKARGRGLLSNIRSGLSALGSGRGSFLANNAMPFAIGGSALLGAANANQNNDAQERIQAANIAAQTAANNANIAAHNAAQDANQTAWNSAIATNRTAFNDTNNANIAADTAATGANRAAFDSATNANIAADTANTNSNREAFNDATNANIAADLANTNSNREAFDSATNANIAADTAARGEAKAIGAPYRQRLNDLYNDPSSFLRSDQVQVPLQQGTNMLARSLGVNGNPMGSGNSLQALQDYTTEGMWSKLGAERDRLAGFGGLSAYNSLGAQNPLQRGAFQANSPLQRGAFQAPRPIQLNSFQEQAFQRSSPLQTQPLQHQHIQNNALGELQTGVGNYLGYRQNQDLIDSLNKPTTTSSTFGSTGGGNTGVQYAINTRARFPNDTTRR